MDQKDLLSGAADDLRSALSMVAYSKVSLGDRVEAALKHLTGEHLDAFAARETLQEVQRNLLKTDSASEDSESDRLLHLIRAADQKLTAALSAGHYSEG